MNNRKLGNTFETELCEILFRNGYWVHNLVQNQSGQPADVIAVRNTVAYLIDCKVCSGKGFPLSRVEENQDSSMSLWSNCGNGEGWFAIKLDGMIYMVPHTAIRTRMATQSAMTAQDIHECGQSLNEWVTKCK